MSKEAYCCTICVTVTPRGYNQDPDPIVPGAVQTHSQRPSVEGQGGGDLSPPTHPTTLEGSGEAVFF